MALQTRADHLAQLIEDKLGTRGQGLEAKLARAGRSLPADLRRELGYVVSALQMQTSPRLVRQIDWPRIDHAFDAAEAYLRRVDPWDRRKGLAINWLAGNALNLVIVAALTLAVMAWRGLV